MALLNAGSKLTTSLKALQWQRSGLVQADLAALVALITDPTAGEFGASANTSKGYIENGFLFVPRSTRYPQGIKLEAGDWIMVDGAGNPIVIPNGNFSTSWQHS